MSIKMPDQRDFLFYDMLSSKYNLLRTLREGSEVCYLFVYHFQFF